MGRSVAPATWTSGRVPRPLKDYHKRRVRTSRVAESQASNLHLRQSISGAGRGENRGAKCVDRFVHTRGFRHRSLTRIKFHMATMWYAICALGSRLRRTSNYPPSGGIVTNRKLRDIVKDQKPLVLAESATVQEACRFMWGRRTGGAGSRQPTAFDRHFYCSRRSTYSCRRQ